MRQSDVAGASRVSTSTVSRIERSHLDSLSLGAIRSVARALDIRLDLTPRWRGGGLDRLVNARHSALHETLAQGFRTTPAWKLMPEVSFSIFGERGIIDVLAWHEASRALLVVELKTDVVDVQELIGSIDRKRRLGWRVAEERGLSPLTVSCWVAIVAAGTNRRRVDRHAAVLANAFPVRGVRLRGWLRRPDGEIAALSFVPILHAGTSKQSRSTGRRVRRPQPSVNG